MNSHFEILLKLKKNLVYLFYYTLIDNKSKLNLKTFLFFFQEPNYISNNLVPLEPLIYSGNLVGIPPLAKNQTIPGTFIGDTLL